MRRGYIIGLGMGAVAAAALVGGSLAATRQDDQSKVCASRDQLVDQLGQQFQESQKAVGVLGEQSVVEVYTSPAGTWTILTTDTEGNSCIMAAGEGWDDGFAATVGNEGVGA